jgi:tetratricopeptide (TPR) repeat protein
MKVSSSIRIFSLAASIAIVAGTAAAQTSAQRDSLQRAEDRYSACMTMADQVPDKAINMALAWIADGGGVPARHCEAYGLSRMGEHAEAAARMMKIAQDMRIGRDMPIRMGARVVATAEMLADMYGQAANAWLMAGEIIRAEDAIDVALTLSPDNSAQELDLLLDRARIAAADKDFSLALKDLELVSKADPGRKDILVLLASAARGTGDYTRADQVLAEYLAVFPNDPAGQLELGNLRHAQGDKAAARTAWLRVLLLEDSGINADAARANLEKMDVTAE